MEVSDQLHAPIALLLGKEPLIPIGLCGPQRSLNFLCKNFKFSDIVHNDEIL